MAKEVVHPRYWDLVDRFESACVALRAALAALNPRPPTPATEWFERRDAAIAKIKGVLGDEEAR